MPRVKFIRSNITAADEVQLLDRDYLEYSWSDLLWATLSVGRRSLLDIFAFGGASLMEIIWRCAIIRSKIETQPYYVKGIRRGYDFCYNKSFQWLDGSEKGAITYFLGLALAKLAAERQLNVPWLWHLDIYTKVNNPYGPPNKITYAGGTNSRPDLIGLSKTGDWLVCEAKGRSNSVTNKLRIKAKEQTRQISVVNGMPPNWRYASIARFSGKILAHEWIDPSGWSDKSEALYLDYYELIDIYYQPIREFLNEDRSGLQVRELNGREYLVGELSGLDIWLGMELKLMRILPHLTKQEVTLEMIRGLLPEYTEFGSSETVGLDGIYVSTGKSWQKQE
ncbi:hypothetical protein [Labrenzia sp. R5_0]|jgi:hypothetical protein|uniref:hypothetical protein n=1 Tax=Labrenzia sp. R5_0 TaxID=2821108 RepID=UPI001ADA02A8|nr:hypothetical protein [Labrenzia sp. R5_0]MBO9461698.1 hypothetical protein [Labrenzia sp. R5_0]